MFKFSTDLPLALTGVATFVSNPLRDWQNRSRLGVDLRSMLPLFLLVLGMLIIASTAAVTFPTVFGGAVEQF